MLGMSGVGVLLILLLISAIPAIAVFAWFRLARYPFAPVRFLGALFAGAASFFPALLLQNMLAGWGGLFRAMGKWSLVADIFFRIALTEELSRLLLLVILFSFIRRFSQARPVEQAPEDKKPSATTVAGAAGLIAGLGFALLESAVYGASNPGNALLRAFTAAPLHGACGFRIGSSIGMFRESPASAVFRFLRAVIIHGIYNFMLLIPGTLPPIAAILIAISALASAIVEIRNGMQGENAA